MEELKNNQGTQLENLQKDLQRTKDSESDINKKLEQLKKKYDQESQNFKNTQENDKLLTDQKLNELES
jgi:chromosome segregation and condensation protein ScpB